MFRKDMLTYNDPGQLVLVAVLSLCLHNNKEHW